MEHPDDALLRAVGAAPTLGSKCCSRQPLSALQDFRDRVRRGNYLGTIQTDRPFSLERASAVLVQHLLAEHIVLGEMLMDREPMAIWTRPSTTVVGQPVTVRRYAYVADEFKRRAEEMGIKRLHRQSRGSGMCGDRGGRAEGEPTGPRYLHTVAGCVRASRGRLAMAPDSRRALEEEQHTSLVRAIRPRDRRTLRFVATLAMNHEPRTTPTSPS